MTSRKIYSFCIEICRGCVPIWLRKMLSGRKRRKIMKFSFIYVRSFSETAMEKISCGIRTQIQLRLWSSDNGFKKLAVWLKNHIPTYGFSEKILWYKDKQKMEKLQINYEKPTNKFMYRYINFRFFQMKDKFCGGKKDSRHNLSKLVELNGTNE